MTRTVLATIAAVLLAVTGCRDAAQGHRRRGDHGALPTSPAERASAPAKGSYSARPAPVPTVAPQAGDDPAPSPHCALGCPTPTTMGADDYVLVRSGYVVGYSPAHRVPSWAAWRLTRADYGGTDRHAGHFLPDTTLPRGWYQVTHADYGGTGYDRGHLVDSGDRTASRQANDQTFLLTNVAPMRPDLNRGPWERLEAECRTRARHDGRVVYVVAGPVWPTDPPDTIGPGHVAVPVAFWKVAVVLAPGAGPEAVTRSTPVLAAIMPNRDGVHADGWRRYETTLADVERMAGYRVDTKVRTALGAP
jgi:endonuclease G